MPCFGCHCYRKEVTPTQWHCPAATTAAHLHGDDPCIAYLEQAEGREGRQAAHHIFCVHRHPTVQHIAVITV